MGNQVGFQGFVCPQTKEKVAVSFCAKDCPNPCYSLPELLAFAEVRPIVERQYSVTEILRPPQQFYLMRHIPYWLDPKSAIWAVFGTGWHGVIEGQKDAIKELGLDSEFKIEEPFSVEAKTSHGDVRLVGRPDLKIISRRELWDFKTIKAFKVKMLKKNTPSSWEAEQYYWQTNIYRVFSFPEAERIFIECVIKDWSERVLEKDGLHPIERVSVPVGDLEKIKAFTLAKVEEYAGYDIDEVRVPPCRNDELWPDASGKPKRCLSYCSVSDQCPQFKEWKSQNS